jgi:hypothetical protein
MSAWIGGNDENLSKGWVCLGCRVDLGPAKTIYHASWAIVNEQHRGVKLGCSRQSMQPFGIPTALIRMPRKGSVIYPKKPRIISANIEGAEFYQPCLC